MEIQKGDYVIVRARDAGVIFGRLHSYENNGMVHVTEARQLWQWHAKKGGVLIDVANFGVKPNNCKFNPAQGIVTVFNACALIKCTDEAVESIKSVKGDNWQ